MSTALLPKWKNLCVAAGLLAVAAYTFVHHGSPWTIGLAVGGALYLLVISFAGMQSDDGSDVNDALDFVRNPTGTIMRSGIEQIATEAEQDLRRSGYTAFGKLTSLVFDGGGGVDDGKPFDADAAIARYLSNRPKGPGTSAGTPVVQARTFGRKAT